MVSIQKMIFKIYIYIYIYKLQKCVTEKRTYVNKECSLLNPYPLTDLLSLPFDKLPAELHLP